MSSLSKTMLIGYLGQDPEIRYTAVEAKAVATLSIGTTEKWKDKSTGEIKEATEWHRVIFFGRRAEIAREYLAKGSHVYIEGKNRTRKWQDNDGNDRFTTEIIGDELKMLSRKPNAQGTGSAQDDVPGFAGDPGPSDADIPFDENGQ